MVYSVTGGQSLLRQPKMVLAVDLEVTTPITLNGVQIYDNVVIKNGGSITTSQGNKLELHAKNCEYWIRFPPQIDI